MSDDATPFRDDGSAGAPEAPPEPTALARERDEYKDLLLRRTAEFDNYRKRVERERRDYADQANADLLRDLLPLIDDLERAAQAGPGEDVAAYRQGVALIARRLHDVLSARGVSVIDPIGQPFDPHEHEAVVREARADVPEGHVVDVMAKGYRLKDRLLRPAMVKVSA